MTFAESVRTCFSKYVTFSGRAARSEFWWWTLFVFVSSLVLGFVDSTLFGTVESYQDGYGFSAQTNTPIISGIFGLATLLPSLAVAVRRLHDRDKSGWWILLPWALGAVLFTTAFSAQLGGAGGSAFGLIAMVIGVAYLGVGIMLIVWLAMLGTVGPNRYGEDPLGGTGGPSGGEGLTASSIPNVPRD